MGVDLTRRHEGVATIDNLNQGVIIAVEAIEDARGELIPKRLTN
jgi:hypothetical protein